MFHEKAKIIDLLDKRFIGDIDAHKQTIDFQAFLSQFKNEDEITDFDIQDLLNVDFENLAEIKEKCKKYIEVINSKEIELDNEEESDKLLLFFADKLNVIIFSNVKLNIFILLFCEERGFIFALK